MADRDHDDFVVLPNSFLDGWSGREVKVGYNGEPRIKCLSEGKFQHGAGTATETVIGISTTVNTFSADGGHSPRPVSADGFIRVGLPNPPSHPNGQVSALPPGGAWPPPWWPTKVKEPSLFEPDLQPKIPPWAEEGDDNGDGNGETGETGTTGTTGMAAPMTAHGAVGPEPSGWGRRRKK